MGSSRQFRLLLWKNWLLQKRKIALTVFEILLPTLFSLILLLIKQRIETQPVDVPTTWPSFSVGDSLPARLEPPATPGRWIIPYSPDIPVVARIMDRVSQRLDVITQGFGFATEDDFVSFYQSGDQQVNAVLGGICFQGVFPNNESIPLDSEYKIRLTAEQYGQTGGGVRFLRASSWLTSAMYPFSLSVGPRNRGSTDGGVPDYYREGFLHLQRAVDLAITQELNGTAPVGDVGVNMKRFPYPPYTNDPFVAVLQRQFPFIVLLSFIIIAPNICKDIVLEKEKKLKETMKMMGLKNWLHWCAWFVKYLIFAVIATFIMTLFLHLNVGSRGAIINYTDPSVTFVFLLLYAIATIFFCFAISTFCSKASAGAAAGAIVYLITYVPYFFLQFRYETMTAGEKTGACVLHNLAMAFGCVQLSLYEGAGVGLQWHNLNTPVNSDFTFTMMHVFLLLIMDCVIYLIITWYFDAIMPGDFGIPKPPYFPFTKWYWCGKDSVKAIDPSDVEDVSSLGDRAAFYEQTHPGMNAGIQIRHLRKEFTRGGMKTAAVDDLVLDMYEGQITALLGHNGAGKTTCMFMLTGFLPPTSGTAYVNGYDIRTDIEKIRESLGLCPQHDVLFDTMTVQEHLIFFAKLKGCTGKKVQEEVDNMIRVTNLEDKRNSPANSLSGGMKRKLSVGIALIGGSKIVILDEPTSGMDPEARRQTWDILQSQRQGRTMILTTHFMDEADLLGDRIAIMANSVMQCAGSSLFLKSKYGVGYHMVMVKDVGCDVDTVSGVIFKYIPEATLESNISAELSFLLPKESSDKFEQLFTHLEENKDQLCIASFGASVTTMEEVFIRVGEEVDKGLEARLQKGTTNDYAANGVENEGFVGSKNAHLNNYTDVNHSPPVAWASPPSAKRQNLGSKHTENGYMDVHENGDTNFVEDGKGNEVSPGEIQLKPSFGVSFERNGGNRRSAQQFRAMFEKRVIHSWRNSLVTVVQIIVPLFFTIIACVVLITLPGPRDPPPINLDLSHFPDPQVPYLVDVETNDDWASSLAASYVKSLQGQASIQHVNPVITGEQDMDEYLVNISENNFPKYNIDYMIAGSFIGNSSWWLNKSTIALAHFNNEAYHSTAISLNYIGNALLKLFGGEEYDVTTINHPLPRTSSARVADDLNTGYVVSFIVSWCVSFGMAFLVGTFVLLLIKERMTKSKHIQYVSGVHVANYWVSAFLWDLINYLIPALLLIAVFAGFNIEAYYKGANGGYVFLIFLLYAWSVLPFVYLLSFAFDVPSSGYVWITVLNIFTGTAAVMAVLILKFPTLDTEEVAVVLEWIFYILLPNFCFGNSLNDLYTNYEALAVCREFDQEIGIDREVYCPVLGILNITNPCCPDNCGSNCAAYDENYFGWSSPGIGRGVTFMTLQGFIFFFILLLLESGQCRGACSKAVSGSYSSMEHDDEDELISLSNINQPGTGEDNDVKTERKRITETPLQELIAENTLILTETKKYYGNFLAVDRLSMGVPQGECFGLLGVNGAGKTTTFKMLTGDEMLSSGEAYLGGFSVKQDIKEVQRRLGYCPQFDALIEQMTVRETLRMYARLRGVVERDIPKVVENLIHSLLLQDHIDKEAGKLSGGNKRKLSTAIALIGDPPIIFLDEPTTGMDPVARRLLWDTLTRVRASGRTLVLTSHSMEECEALCTRMAIMVNGQFKCLGSTQHLKHKFGEGYTLIAKIRNVNISDLTAAEVEMESQMLALRTFIENEFPGSELKDAHIGLVHYQIKSEGLSWASVFGTMERAKDRYNIEDYSVSQTTLEQVFINFARAQREPRDTSMTCSVKCKNCCQFFCCKCCCT